MNTPAAAGDCHDDGVRRWRLPAAKRRCGILTPCADCHDQIDNHHGQRNRDKLSRKARFFGGFIFRGSRGLYCTQTANQPEEAHIPRYRSDQTQCHRYQMSASYNVGPNAGKESHHQRDQRSVKTSPPSSTPRSDYANHTGRSKGVMPGQKIWL